MNGTTEQTERMNGRINGNDRLMSETEQKSKNDRVLSYNMCWGSNKDHSFSITFDHFRSLSIFFHSLSFAFRSSRSLFRFRSISYLNTQKNITTRYHSPITRLSLTHTASFIIIHHHSLCLTPLSRSCSLSPIISFPRSLDFPRFRMELDFTRSLILPNCFIRFHSFLSAFAHFITLNRETSGTLHSKRKERTDGQTERTKEWTNGTNGRMNGRMNGNDRLIERNRVLSYNICWGMKIIRFRSLSITFDPFRVSFSHFRCFSVVSFTFLISLDFVPEHPKKHNHAISLTRSPITHSPKT